VNKHQPNTNMPDDWIINGMKRDQLSDGDFQNLNLEEIRLNGANMSRSNFTATSFDNAQLRGVNLSDAILRGANLRSADLTGANLTGADLRGADLRGTDLSNTNLSEVKLSGAYVRDAKFIGCHGIEKSVIQNLKQHKAIVEEIPTFSHSQDSNQQWQIQFLVPIIVAVIGATGLIIANLPKTQTPVQPTTIEKHK
jgi:uncharacterized protein YjbI with pentapeptide repeats